jgi:hypothetical protein
LQSAEANRSLRRKRRSAAKCSDEHYIVSNGFSWYLRKVRARGEWRIISNGFEKIQGEAERNSLRQPGVKGALDDATSLQTSSERTWTELIASIASLIDAIACLTFQVALTAPGTGARLFIMLLLDPIACILGYWVMYQRLRYTRPKLAELGLYLLILGTLFVICLSVVEESASLNLVKLDYSTASGFGNLLVLLVTVTVPFGLAIYAWLIATSSRLRRWLGFIIGVQVVIVLIALASFIFPQLNDFVNSELFTVVTVIPTLAKAVWFLSPVDVSKSAAR